MKSSTRLIEPAQSFAYIAANDNFQHTQRAPVMARAKSGRLFPSPEENLLAVQTLNRIDAILASAESDVGYARAEEGQYSRPSAADEGDYIGGPAIVEVSGRSAGKILEDFTNGTVRCFDPHPLSLPCAPEREVAELREHGRFRFNDVGVICGYRLNREYHGSDQDTWVKPSHPKHPDNVSTPRDRKARDPRGQKPGKTAATDIVTPANDNFDARSCLAWIKTRMAPEHYEAVYDATAGMGFLHIGTSGGFSGKQAEAVGKDRLLCGLRQAARLLIDWDTAD
ncbi:hypothetical protein A4U53_025695 [Rhizobium ruizarguesonis]|uniref:Uncharacterized protein n=2 Tax=Rhizobium TaxID=379 RepID=A0A179C211_RHILE|nr:hypothetical protein [Rhizobium leguminosarum]OAP97706.1 hypothetical protein A4U53_36245 [Rhizobium leguminosarum]